MAAMGTQTMGANSPDPVNPDGCSAKDAIGAPCRDAAAKSQRTGAATTGEERQAYDLELPHETGVYLLAIVRDGQHCRYWHARHYVGWAIDIADRVAAHRRGKGARFTQTLIAQGYGLWLVSWFPGDRTAERAIKLTHHAPRFCPLCRAGLCVIDQPPQYTCMQAPSRAQHDGKALQGSLAMIPEAVDAVDAVPDPARFGQQFRQGQLLHLTEALTATGTAGTAGTAGPGEDVTSAGDAGDAGDTVVELLLSRSAGATRTAI